MNGKLCFLAVKVQLHISEETQNDPCSAFNTHGICTENIYSLHNKMSQWKILISWTFQQEQVYCIPLDTWESKSYNSSCSLPKYTNIEIDVK